MRGIQIDGDFVRATRMPDGSLRIPYVEIFSCNLIFMILLLFLMVALVITTVHLCGWRRRRVAQTWRLPVPHPGSARARLLRLLRRPWHLSAGVSPVEAQHSQEEGEATPLAAQP